MAEKIDVPFPNIKKIPDPTRVITTWDWYFLDQVSSSLIKWNDRANSFQGALAKSWKVDGKTITFRLKDGLSFSNGLPITASDVEASVKRALFKKSSSHFRPWELLENCENVSKFSDSCPGIEIKSPVEISFHLKYPSESFFLFMACPEGGIWAKEDSEKDEFAPKAFSGPYLVADKSEKAQILNRNIHWVFDMQFPNRPNIINAFWAGEKEFQEGIQNGNYDLYLDLERPFGSKQPPLQIYEAKYTAFNTLYYLFGVNSGRKNFMRSCLASIWSKAFPQFLMPATTFLPFEALSGISKEEILAQMPNERCHGIRIGYLKGYFDERFIEFLFDDTFFELVPMQNDHYFKSFTSEYSNGDVDFVLSPYVASERYPSVQINFLMEDRKVPFDLNILDHRDLIAEKKQLLKDIQMWMVKDQLIIPLVFGRSVLTYKKEIKIGDQPLIDSEIQLWRVNE